MEPESPTGLKHELKPSVSLIKIKDNVMTAVRENWSSPYYFINAFYNQSILFELSCKIVVTTLSVKDESNLIRRFV